jgi:alcohol dehydrogenase (NADP+)
LLAPFGTLCIVALPEENIPPFNAQSIAAKNASIAGSHIGPPGQIREMLQFAAEHNVRTWVERRPLTKEGIDQALSDVAENRVKFRVVLVPAGVPQ